MKVLENRAFILTAGNVPENKDSIYISKSLLKKWELNHGDSIFVKAGINQLSLQIRQLPGRDSLVKLAEESMQVLLIPLLTFPVRVQYYPNENRLTIGPILALLTNHTPNSLNGTFDNDIFYRELSSYCNEQGFIFYLLKLQTLEDSQVLGYYPTEDHWERTILPMPNVIYNRLHSRKLEKSVDFQHFVLRLQELAIPLFNGGFLSKWEVHELLSAENSLLPFLPETVPLKIESDFITFLLKHPAVYVKPSFGSQGKNICKLTQTSEGWVIEHSNNLTSFLVESEAEVFRILKKQSRKRSYIIQKGISLFELDDQKTDFRVLLIKNKQHNWKIVSIIARTGHAGHIVSNLARGGEMENGLEFLLTIFEPAKAYEIYQTLSQLALKTAEVLSTSRSDLFGELGIDLALDTDYFPWIIEVNSKPSKKFIGNYVRFRPSVRKIIDYMYALYLNTD
ncbi:YheC/YheD family protein [Peribacillus psychrosaccharolyticus]|uniref:YheC/YheD family protein n=1 Tax=Peribacillus psychrosaccharolyticus TaxID=1407 RepID=A0A974S1Z0_PERPY|nr:YheC/YheD family protein [Peribacillus psychrosaccharolyticus]MEC2054920.1 YheC/YheD family protein [Peribacillus psychrosaccharolyticus]MED3744637.1 YheC/YheD family protein [Peribacillus psychrosaccharolyticus]QQT02157.1 YheC/YheD family protein [Peribacillus psychrosaccharolyticus]